MEDVVYKNPEQTINFEVDFANLLTDNDASLTGESAVATKTDGNTDATVIGTLTKDGLVLTVPLKAGTDGEDYVIVIKATGDDSSIIAVFTIEMRVRIEEIGNF